MPTASAAAARAAYWASCRRTASPKVYSAMDQGRLRGSRLAEPESRDAARATRLRRGIREQGSGNRLVAPALSPACSVVLDSKTAGPSTAFGASRQTSLRMTSLFVVGEC